MEKLVDWGWKCDAGEPGEANGAEAPSAPAEPEVDDES